MARISRTQLIPTTGLLLFLLSGCGTFIYVPSGNNPPNLELYRQAPSQQGLTEYEKEVDPPEDRPCNSPFELTAIPDLPPLPTIDPSTPYDQNESIDRLVRHIANVRDVFRNYLNTLSSDYDAYRSTCYSLE